MTANLPPRKHFKTPRPLMADAYTISGFLLESDEATENSVYYLTFRKFPETPGVYLKDDERIVFAGLQRILDRILRDPVTHEEIDETKLFLENRKATMIGFAKYEFPEALWRRVVDEFNGYLPIKIEAMPEGSVVYPNEPVIRVTCQMSGLGPLIPWFESTFIKVWSATERTTAARHWLQYNRDMVASIEVEADKKTINFLAGLMMHDFGARAGACNQENEDVAYSGLYSFGGTDTFEAAYQAFKNGAPEGVGTSVLALAHRIVQGFETEKDCYDHMYAAANDNEILSMVADCYDYYNAVENYLLPLAEDAKKKGNGKVIVVRPDSGDALEQILWTLDLAVKNGLYEERNGYKYMTNMRMIEGDSMTFETMRKINDALIVKGFAPHGCLIYGVGGHLRNSISRDNLSTKFALCGVGDQNRPVIKISETRGKRTLPLVKILRTPDALTEGTTLVDPSEAGLDAMISYYNGTNNDTPFGKGQYDSFPDIQARVLEDFDTMPMTAGNTSKKVEATWNSLYHRYHRN